MRISLDLPDDQLWTATPNSCLNDPRLSFKAKGLVAFMLACVGAGMHALDSATLARVGPDGRDAVRTGLRELEDAGYLIRVKRQSERGRWATHVRLSPVSTRPPIRSITAASRGA